MVYDKQSGHIGGSFSLAELISILYTDFEIHKNRNQLVLSKGHAIPIIYAVLKEIGILTDKDLDTFREVDSKLQGHPYAPALPEHIHATTGSLGQGLSVAIGKAIALKKLNLPHKIFCILGDGEIQEGQIWEGLMFAPKEKLNNLIVFVDVNGLQGDGQLIYDKNYYLHNLPDILDLLGWDSWVVKGHQESEIKERLEEKQTKPRIIFLNTIKGKGVSFMENNNDWHSKSPNKEQYELALQELQDG
jgi:transketolase